MSVRTQFSICHFQIAHKITQNSFSLFQDEINSLKTACTEGALSLQGSLKSF